MPLTRDQELLGAALAIERQHGDRAAVFVAERIGAAALAGDAFGVELGCMIAAKLDQLRRPAPGQ